jgi:hypothetical protein
MLGSTSYKSVIHDLFFYCIFVTNFVLVQFQVIYKQGLGGTTVTDDQIKGTLRVSFTIFNGNLCLDLCFCD